MCPSRARMIACWILEFVLQQPIDDWIVNRLVTVLPLPNEDIHLKKSILLRRISSEASKGIISEKILDSLEMIEELNSISPMISSEAAATSMRTAYGYVVVANILSFLGDNPNDEAGDYYSTMQRIWTERISKMELAGSMGFVPKCWKEVRMELEAVVVAMAGGERVRTHELRKKAVRVALESLQEFLVIAASDLGLPFLGVVSGYVEGKHHDLDGVWKSVISCLGVRDALQAAPTVEVDADRRACAQMPNDRKVSPHRPPSIGCGPKQEASAAFMKADASNRKGGVSHVQVIDDSNLGDAIGFMQTQAIHKVQAALKSSALNLQLAVEDPLPNALEMVRQMENKSIIGGEDCNNETSKEILHNALGNPKTVGTTEMSDLEEPSTGNLRGSSSGGQCTHSHGRMTKPSLFDWNKTAQTYEWGDESVEPLLEKSQSHSRAIHLPSPKRLKVSPLQRQDATRYTRRRKINRWSPFEEETLRDAVKKCGVGRWKFILNCHREIFEARTEIDLKDKWRNMTRP